MSAELLPDPKVCHELLYALTRPPNQNPDIYRSEAQLPVVLGELLFQYGWRRGQSDFDDPAHLYVIAPSQRVYRLFDLAPINDEGEDELRDHVIWLWGFNILQLLETYFDTLTTNPPTL